MISYEGDICVDKRDKLRELISYAVFGVLTTLVNFVVYTGLELVLRPRWGDHSYLFSHVAAFIAALVFAFVVNKLFVFKQKSWEARLVLHEAWTFTAARLFSFGLETLFTVVFFEMLWLRCDAWFTPLWLRVPVFAELLTPNNAFRYLTRYGIIAVLVVIMNYFFSKWVVFRKKKEEAAE